MRLIVNEGARLDRPPITELECALLHYKHLNYGSVTDAEKQRFRLLLELEHQKREAIRYGKSCGVSGAP